MERVRSAVRWLQHFADRWWYFPILGLLAGADLFILVVPTDAILISSVMLQPRRWVSAFVWVALGSAIGAVAFAAVIQWDTNLVMEHWFPDAFDSAAWQAMDSFFDEWGGSALLLIACSPLVQFPAVALAALSGMSLTKIFFVCLLGRSIKSALFSYGASHAPKLLMKLPFIQRELSLIYPPETPR